MRSILILGLLTGLDNLQVTSALGLMKMSRRQRCLLALMFGVAEAVMPLIGFFVGSVFHVSISGFVEPAETLALIACGAAILVASLCNADLTSVFASKKALLWVPLLFSIDNFFAGLGLSAVGSSLPVEAVVVGAISAAMSLAGLSIGGLLRRWNGGMPDWIGGALLLGLGAYWTI